MFFGFISLFKSKLKQGQTVNSYDTKEFERVYIHHQYIFAMLLQFVFQSSKVTIFFKVLSVLNGLFISN